MSRQLKSIKIFPSTGNRVQIQVNDDDYEQEDAINKIIVRTPDHFATDIQDIHTHVKDGAGTVLNVISQEPLIIETSGYEGTLDGYDGLLVGLDGYYARGVIKTQGTNVGGLLNPAFFSIHEHYYYLAGYDALGSDGYTNAIWHSSNGISYERLSSPPWSGRAGAYAVSNGTKVWLLGGWDETGPIKDLWMADINTSTGVLTWAETAVSDDVGILDDYFKATINPNTLDAYVGAGVIDLVTGEVNAVDFGTDGYDSLIHYDTIRNMLWFSKDGYRTEYIFDTSVSPNNIITNNNSFGYVHNQGSASTSWVINHNLGDQEVAVVSYTSSREILEPAQIIYNAPDQITLNFTAAKAGKAFVCFAEYFGSATSWTTSQDAFSSEQAFWLVGLDGSIIEPLAVVSPTEVSFITPTDGYVISWSTHLGPNVMGGRRYIADFMSGVGTTTITPYQDEENQLWVIRDSDGFLVEPNDLTYTSSTATADFLSVNSLHWATMDMRHNDSVDLMEPFNEEVISMGLNTNDTQIQYAITGSNNAWYSSDGGSHWVGQDSIDLFVLPHSPTPINTESNMVSVVNIDFGISRSLDSGDNFVSTINQTNTDTLEFYDDLGITVDTSYKLFIYKRPSDVVWESNYGFIPTDILDDYNTHYILPAPASVSASNSQIISLVLNAEYGRDLRAEELLGHWLYITLDGVVVERAIITKNSAALAGEVINIYANTTTTITASHRVQIIKPRPEGTVFVSAITRHNLLKYTLYYEEDNSAFNLAQEQVWDYYADLISNGGLPDVVSAIPENVNRVNLLHAELNRQRVKGTVFYNDPMTLPPDLLLRLGNQLGVDLDESFDVRNQRYIIAQYFDKVNRYGASLQAVNNLIDLTLGAGSGVEASIGSEGNIAGLTLNISISNYADYSWTWDTANQSITYDPVLELWELIVPLAFVPAELSSIIHRSLVAWENGVIQGPELIVYHSFGGAQVSLYFNEEDISYWLLTDDSTRLGIFSEPKQRKLFKFIQILNKILPFWVERRYT